MKHFRRWLANGAALISLAACLVTLSFWIETRFFFEEDIVVHPFGYTCFVGTGAGPTSSLLIDLYYYKQSDLPGIVLWKFRPSDAYYSLPNRWYHEPRGYHAEEGWMINGNFHIFVPFLFLFLITAPAPVLRFALPFIKGGGLTKLRNHWRSKPGICSQCGYDLTGNVSGVCPECGTITPDVAGVASSPRTRKGLPEHEQAS